MYKYGGKKNRVQDLLDRLALIKTVQEAKKGELDSSSFTAQDLVKLAVKQGNLITNQDPFENL